MHITEIKERLKAAASLVLDSRNMNLVQSEIEAVIELVDDLRPEPDLLPCPHCGAEVAERDSCNLVRCSECPASMHVEEDGLGAFSLEETVVRAWNRRTPGVGAGS